MDRYGLGIVGAILAMVIAGLIVQVLVMYGPSILNRSSGGISIADIVNNPSKYEGRDVEVVGDLGQIMGGGFGWVLENGIERVLLENGWTSVYTLTAGNYSLRIAIKLGVTVMDLSVVNAPIARIRVQGVFKSPNIILAKRISKA